MIDGPYYLYQNKPYFSRESVAEAMLLNKDFDVSFEFKFADNIFDKIDWSKDINVSIETLYRMRAKQLREKYKIGRAHV